MRVLLTGATGFLGSRAAAHLAEAGAEVVALVRPGSDRTRLEALAPRTRIEEGALQSRESIEAIVARARPDLCVHLAWYAVPGKYLSAPENLDHLDSTLHLARALERHGARRLVTAGTCFEYDTSAGLLAERGPVAPRFLYAACKLAVGEVLREWARIARSWNHCHLRFFYQYGPFEPDGRLVPSVVRALLCGQPANVTSGEQIRDYLHVDDVGRAIAQAALSSVEGPLNVGSGVPIRVRDLVESAARACGRPDLVRLGALPRREGDPPFVCADVSRLRAIGWSPRWSLEEGLADTVRFWRTRMGR